MTLPINNLSYSDINTKVFELTFFFSYFNRLKIDQLFQYLDVQIRIHKAFDRNFLQFASSYGMPSQDCPLISRLLKCEMDSFQAKFSVALKL